MNLPSSEQDTARKSPLHLGVVSVTALSLRLDDRMNVSSYNAHMEIREALRNYPMPPRC